MVERLEVRGEVTCDLDAYLGDAERIEEASEVRPGRSSNGVHEIESRLLGKAGQAPELLHVQVEQIGQRVDEAPIDEEPSGLTAETLDVERVT